MTLDLSYTIADGTMRDLSLASRMVGSAIETAIEAMRGNGALRVSGLSVTLSGKIEVPDDEAEE